MVTARILPLLLLLMLTPVAAADDEYAIMHPDAAQLASWNAAYGRAPAVADNPALLRAVTAPNGSQDLLPFLDHVPADRNQGRAGNCWAWAGTGVREIAHAVQGGIRDRLSVEYLDANYRPSSPGYRCADDGVSSTTLRPFTA